jgi:peptide/nickel transport system permease protein
MKVWQYILKRLFLLIPVLIGVTMLTFTLSHIVPGDPVDVVLGPYRTPEMVKELEEEWGLDKPIYVQYLRYLNGLLRGDLGTSLHTNRPVAQELMNYFPATLELTTVSMLFCIIIGLPLGIIAATRKDKLADHASRVFSLIGTSMPIFWLGLLVLLVFYFKLGVIPVGGRISQLVSPPRHITGLYILDSLLTGNWLTLKDSLIHILMPAFVVGFTILGVFARQMRSSMLDVLGEDYIRTAEAKGLSRYQVIYQHALRNGILPVITISGTMYGQMLSGAVLVETIFSWPGIGRYAVTSIMKLDFQPIMGFAILIAAVKVTVTLLVDILYVLFDPRIRL